MKAEIKEKLIYLNLPGIREILDETIQSAINEGLSFETFFDQLLDHECTQRKNYRVERLLREAKLSLQKTFETFDLKRLPVKVVQKIRSLEDGGFL